MIKLYFGNPGAGKTTLCCKLAKQARKKYKHVYTCFPSRIPGVASADVVDIGKWRFPRGSIAFDDEAGISFNSRAYKSMSQPCIAYFKKHRQHENDWVLTSQSWEDTDVTLRRLTVELWYLYRIGPWTLSRRLKKRCTVDKATEQIIDGYQMASLLWLFIWPLQLGWPFEKKFELTFRPFYYRYFDSWLGDDTIPVKDFPVYVKEKK